MIRANRHDVLRGLTSRPSGNSYLLPAILKADVAFLVLMDDARQAIDVSIW
jgi:hypothetical protein